MLLLGQMPPQRLVVIEEAWCVCVCVREATWVGGVYTREDRAATEYCEGAGKDL